MGKLQNMKVGILLGDAAGAGYEFAFKTRKEYQTVDLTRYRQHSNPEFCHKAGMYTDDGQMSIGVTELLVSDLEFNRLNLADSFVRVYKRDPAVGYSKRVKKALDESSSGTEFLSNIDKNVTSNGAAMRSVPLGVIKDLDQLIEHATINAQLTHNTPKGIASSIAVGIISHYNLYHGRNPDWTAELIPHIEKVDIETASYLTAISHMQEFDAELLLGFKYIDKGVPCDGMRTVGAVMYILSHYDNPTDVLVESIRLGGDTDSVASIALGITMINKPLSDLPKPLYDNLINHQFGKDYVLELGRKLEQKYLLAPQKGL